MQLQRTETGATDWSRVQQAGFDAFTGPRSLGDAIIVGPDQPPRKAAPTLAAGRVAPAAASGPDEIAQARTHAALAADVYNDRPNPPAGWRTADAGDLRALNLRPRDLESGAFRARVYVTGQGAGERYVVAFRGTRSSEDWRANLRQGSGGEARHYQQALAIGEAVARTKAPAMLTGHSLGGGLASAAAIVSGREADTFNAAGLHPNTIGRALQINRSLGGVGPGRVDAYHVRGEVLSGVQDGGDRVAGWVLGGIAGSALADAPSAYGLRHRLDAVTPAGKGWRDRIDPVDRHGMDWVQSGLAARAAIR